MNLKLKVMGVAFFLLNATGAAAQTSTTEQGLVQLSKNKWQWMADKDVGKLEPLFHDESKFVHMSGTWKKADELDINETGSIWYKKTDVHDVAVEVVENTGPDIQQRAGHSHDQEVVAPGASFRLRSSVIVNFRSGSVSHSS